MPYYNVAFLFRYLKNLIKGTSEFEQQYLIFIKKLCWKKCWENFSKKTISIMASREHIDWHLSLRGNQRQTSITAKRLLWIFNYICHYDQESFHRKNRKINSAPDILNLSKVQFYYSMSAKCTNFIQCKQTATAPRCFCFSVQSWLWKKTTIPNFGGFAYFQTWWKLKVSPYIMHLQIFQK